MALLRLFRLTAAVCLGLLASAGPGFAQVRVADERELKAAYLFNMAKFVDWPPAAFEATGGSFVIGVLGDDALASTLASKLTGKQAQGRAIRVRSYESPGEVEPCQMLFVTAARTGVVRQILNRMDGQPILLIGQSDRLIGSGGSINFYNEGDTIRFEISPTHAATRGLKISSKLLRLARIVP